MTESELRRFDLSRERGTRAQGSHQRGEFTIKARRE
jgi:hypothetical protein